MLNQNSPLDVRLAAYRQQAERALRQAAVTADPGMRRDFLALAAAWQELIQEAERPLPGEMPPAAPEKLSA